MTEDEENDKIESDMKLGSELGGRINADIHRLFERKWTPSKFAKFGATLTPEQIDEVYTAIGGHVRTVMQEIITDGTVTSRGI